MKTVSSEKQCDTPQNMNELTNLSKVKYVKELKGQKLYVFPGSVLFPSDSSLAFQI